MKKTLLIIPVIFFALCMMGMNSNVSFLGKWEVKRAVAFAHISAMGPDEAKSYAGKKLEYSSKFARFGDDICNNPIYNKTIVSEEEFLKDYDIDFKTLGIKTKSVAIIEIEDWVELGGILIIKNNNTMITIWDGVYFELARIK